MLRSSRVVQLGLIGLLYPCLSGFVLLHNKEATLPVTAQAPTMTFVWDGKSPTITDKDKFKDGTYQALDDTAFMQALIKESMAIWNDVPGSFVRLAVLQGTNVTMDANDKQNSIVVQKNSNVTTAAYAFPQVDTGSGATIIDCDINISDTSVAAGDLAYTLSHELGHCLGLGHAHTNYNAIMGYSRSSRMLTLGDDDKAGIIYLYPDPAVWDGKTKEIICGTVGGVLASAGAWSLLGLLLLPILAVLAPRAAPAKARRRNKR